MIKSNCRINDLVFRIICMPVMISFLSPIFSFGQTYDDRIEIPVEKIQLYTDRDIYLSGEMIWFTAWCEIPGSNSGMSKIMYVELFNASAKSVVQKKYRIENGRVAGALRIPQEFLSANYYLRGYTQYLKNFSPSSYFTKVVTIINPHRPLPEQSDKNKDYNRTNDRGSNIKNTGNTEDKHDSSDQSDKFILDINTDKSIYSTREAVKLDIPLRNIKRGEVFDLSVSVVKKGTSNNGNYSNNRIIEQVNNRTIEQTHNRTIESLDYLPDIRDVSLSGIVIDKNSQNPLSDVLVYLYAARDYPQVHMYKTKGDGKFIFSLNNYEGDQELFLCPLKYKQGDTPEIKIFSDFLTEYPDYEEIPLSIDTTWIKLLQEMLTNFESSQAFNTEPLGIGKKLSHFPYSFTDPPISILLADYIETNDMETVFRELVPRVRLRKKGEDYSLSVFDFDNVLYYDDPLVLIDNLPVFNLNDIMKVPPAYVEKISVINSPLILGENVIKGIIMIFTNTDDFAGVSMPPSSSFLKYRTLEPSYVFKANEYDTKEEANSTAADFRTLLYWNPELIIDSDTSLQFFTSDHTSYYDVIIRGRTTKGREAYGHAEFSVAK